jgi:hypothetical protein
MHSPKKRRNQIGAHVSARNHADPSEAVDFRWPNKSPERVRSADAERSSLSPEQARLAKLEQLKSTPLLLPVPVVNDSPSERATREYMENSGTSSRRRSPRRARLNISHRQFHSALWSRRENSNKGPVAGGDDGAIMSSGEWIYREKSAFMHELDADPTGFASGEVHPGTLHAHGKLFPVHRVTYSVGLAGTYLLHVRRQPDQCSPHAARRRAQAQCVQ